MMLGDGKINIWDADWNDKNTRLSCDDVMCCDEDGCENPATHIHSYWMNEDAIKIEYWCVEHGNIQKVPIWVEIEMDRWGRVKEQFYHKLELEDGVRIAKNSIQCVICGSILVSKHINDFVICTCGLVSCEGGNEYLKRGYGSPDDFLELSEYEENNE